MATENTLEIIADKLLAQFDKILLDNSTDFSSCDQIVKTAPPEHKGGLESLYCDLLLDALISGYYRYSEMDTKQLVDDPLYTKFKKMVYGLDRSDPYNFMDRYDPEQFEILGRRGDLKWAETECDFYTPPSPEMQQKYKDMNNTWRVQNTYILSDEGIPLITYGRIFIQSKKGGAK